MCVPLAGYTSKNESTLTCTRLRLARLCMCVCVLCLYIVCVSTQPSYFIWLTTFLRRNGPPVRIHRVYRVLYTPQTTHSSSTMSPTRSFVRDTHAPILSTTPDQAMPCACFIASRPIHKTGASQSEPPPPPPMCTKQKRELRNACIAKIYVHILSSRDARARADIKYCSIPFAHAAAANANARAKKNGRRSVCVCVFFCRLVFGEQERANARDVRTFDNKINIHFFVCATRNSLAFDFYIFGMYFYFRRFVRASARETRHAHRRMPGIASCTIVLCVCMRNLSQPLPCPIPETKREKKTI